MATPPPRLHLVHFSVDAADEDRDDDDERTTERKGPHTQCALLWCDEATARDPPSGCVPVDPVAGLASLGPGYRGVRGAEAVAALVGACASAAHVVPDATQRSKPDEELRITPNPSSEPLAVSPSAMALCVRVAAALGDDDGWRPTRVCELGSGTGAAGLLVAKEVERLGKLRDGSCQRPFMVVLGGAKLADKIPVLEALAPRVDKLLVGGGMAYTLLKAQGKKVGKSKVDDAILETAAISEID